MCWRDCMPWLRAEAGSRPACESLSFASPKERNQRKGDPTVCVPAAARRGNLWCSGLAGSRSNSLRFTSLRHTRALIRQTLRSSAHPEGQGGQNIHTGLCCARPSLRSAWRLRPRGEAERSNGPCGCSAVGCLAPPLLAAPAAGRLWGGTRVGARVLRELTRRGCLNEAATQRSEFHGAPRNRPDAGLPLRTAKGSQTGGRLFFGDFLLAKQKKVTRTPGDSRPPPSTKACGPISHPTKHYKINSYQRISH